MLKIEHIGIAVNSLDASIADFQKIMATECYKREVVESESVETAFLKTEQGKIELLGSLDDNSPLSRFLKKRGEGIHHIAFEVADIEAEMKRLSLEGFQLLQETPKKGADNKLICFLHPRTTHSVLIELCQEIK